MRPHRGRSGLPTVLGGPRREATKQNRYRAVAQAGFEAGYLATLNITWADTERGRGPTGTCIRTRETVVTKHIATDPKMIPWRAEALKRGYASSVSIPLIVDSEAYRGHHDLCRGAGCIRRRGSGAADRARQRSGVRNRHFADQGRACEGRRGAAGKGRARPASAGFDCRSNLRHRSRRQLHVGQSGLRKYAGLWRSKQAAREESSQPGP